MRLIASILLLSIFPLVIFAEQSGVLPPQFNLLDTLDPLLVFGSVTVFCLWTLYEAHRLADGVQGVSSIASELTSSLNELRLSERIARERLEKRCLELEEEKNALRQQLVSKMPSNDRTSNQQQISTSQVDTRSANGAEILSLLSLLQEKGRFLDFIQQDISSVSNEQLGAVSRVVHTGCKQVLAQCLTLEPLVEKAEGDAVELAAGYDPASWKLLGSVKDRPPYRGTVLHRGWRVVKLERASLPARKESSSVVYPAEIQVQAA